MRINEISDDDWYDDSPMIRPQPYGYWIKPDGELVPVYTYQGHMDFCHSHTTKGAVSLGWVRISIIQNKMMMDLGIGLHVEFANTISKLAFKELLRLSSELNKEYILNVMRLDYYSKVDPTNFTPNQSWSFDNFKRYTSTLMSLKPLR